MGWLSGWLSGWDYRKSHTIGGASGAGSGYQVLIKVYYGSGIDGTEVINGIEAGKIYCGGKCKTDFSDIRFVSSDGRTVLFPYKESSVAGNYAIYWIKIPHSLEVDQTIYIYYGNSDASDVSVAESVVFDITGQQIATRSATYGGGYVQQFRRYPYRNPPYRAVTRWWRYNSQISSGEFALCLLDSSGHVDAKGANVVVTATGLHKVEEVLENDSGGWFAVDVYTTVNIAAESAGSRHSKSGHIAVCQTPTFTASSGYAFNIDVCWRRYTSPEPSHGVWGSEETSSSVTWLYRKPHTINQTAGAGTNYQIGIKVYYGSGTDGTEVINNNIFGKVYLDGKCRTDFGDIRFSDNDGSTELNYWLEEKVDGNYAIFWVKVTDDISAGDVTIYIYYENSVAQSASNGDDTFQLFDDFDAFILDSDKWQTSIINAEIDIVDSELDLKVLTSGSSNRAAVGSKIVYPVPVAVEMKVKWVTGAGTYMGFFGMCGSPLSTKYKAVVSHTVPFRVQWDTAYFKYASGNDSSYELDNYSEEADTDYHRISTKRDGSIDKLMKDTEEITGGYPTDADRLVMLVAYYNVNTEMKADWVAVRKWLATEPVHDTWGEEEQIFTLTITCAQVANVEITVNGSSQTTPYSGDFIVNESVALVFTEPEPILGSYLFQDWGDGDTSKTKTVTISDDLSLEIQLLMTGGAQTGTTPTVQHGTTYYLHQEEITTKGTLGFHRNIEVEFGGSAGLPHTEKRTFRGNAGVKHNEELYSRANAGIIKNEEREIRGSAGYPLMYEIFSSAPAVWEAVKTIQSKLLSVSETLNMTQNTNIGLIKRNEDLEKLLESKKLETDELKGKIKKLDEDKKKLLSTKDEELTITIQERNEAVKNLDKQKKQAKALLKIKDEELTNLLNTKRELEGMIETYKEKVEKQEETIKELNIQLETNKTIVADLEEKLKNVKSSPEPELEQEREARLKQIDELQLKINTLKIMIDEAHRKLQEEERKLAKIRKLRKSEQ